MSNEKMREEFEAWAKNQCMSIKTDGSSYYHHRTSDAWEAWKGAYQSLADTLTNAKKYVAFAFHEGIEGAEQAGIDIESALNVKP